MSVYRLTKENIYEFLEQIEIPYKKEEHAAVFSQKDMDLHALSLQGADTKNLFLVEEKGNRVFLVVVPLRSKISLKGLAQILGVKRLTFGDENKMVELIGITPGSVTPLAIFNDSQNLVQLVIDQAIWDGDPVLMHPMINTATIAVAQEDFRKLMNSSGHTAKVIEIPRVE